MAFLSRSSAWRRRSAGGSRDARAARPDGTASGSCRWRPRAAVVPCDPDRAGPSGRRTARPDPRVASAARATTSRRRDRASRDRRRRRPPSPRAACASRRVRRRPRECDRRDRNPRATARISTRAEAESSMTRTLACRLASRSDPFGSIPRLFGGTPERDLDRGSRAAGSAARRTRSHRRPPDRVGSMRSASAAGFGFGSEWRGGRDSNPQLPT